jgi:hypothetical protein
MYFPQLYGMWRFFSAIKAGEITRVMQACLNAFNRVRLVFKTKQGAMGAPCRLLLI